MPDHFEQALDECIRLVLRGVPVSECLARYPEHAAELEPELAAVTAVVSVYNRRPSATAMLRSRQRLEAELAALAGQERPRPKKALSWLGMSARRWAVAAALLLVLVTAGFGTTTASAHALPGQPLYAVKQATEQVRLAFTFSNQGKADLYLAYAQTRAEEMGALITDGNTRPVPETASSLENDLAAASRLAAANQGQQWAEAFQAKLTTSATESLSVLNQALAQAPEQQQAQVTQVVAQAGASYSKAAEQTAAASPNVVVAQEPGTMQIQATDPPPPGVQSVLVTVRSIEAYLAAGSHSQWVTVMNAATTFDLLKVKNAPQTIGEAQVPAGTYTRIQAHLGDITVVLPDGNQEIITPQQQTLELQRPIAVTAGQTTTVLLDFNGQLSLQVGANGKLKFVPSVLPRLPGPPNQTGVTATPTPNPAHTPTPAGQTVTPVPSPSVTPVPRPVEIHGTVDGLLSNRELTVGGRQVIIDANTRLVGGNPKKGQSVTVTGVEGPSGAITATRIVVGPLRGTATPTPPAGGTPTGEPVTIKGTVERFDLSTMQMFVDNHSVVIPPNFDPANLIVGTKNAGHLSLEEIFALLSGLSPDTAVTVEGLRQPDGTIIASRIIVGATTPAPTPTATPPPSSPTPAPGPGPTGTLEPNPTPVATPEAIAVDGLVTDITLGADLTVQEIVVGGQVVLVPVGTAVPADLMIGSSVHVDGLLYPDGTVKATSIALSF